MSNLHLRWVRGASSLLEGGTCVLFWGLPRREGSMEEGAKGCGLEGGKGRGGEGRGERGKGEGGRGEEARGGKAKGRQNMEGKHERRNKSDTCAIANGCDNPGRAIAIVLC